jgi:peptide-methionine (R)-S-oxide reductase
MSTPAPNMKRRMLLLGGASVAALGWLWWQDSDVKAAGPFEVVKSDDEWRRMLRPEAYRVLRHHATERPYSSALNAEKRKGTYVCGGCDLPLFSSDTKFESGTGWPSFWEPLPKAVGTKEDNSFLMRRTEVHCRRCGGHLGHVFNDGPKPTGLRYCMNGVAMKFVSADGAA